jgi:hypothetical protein
VILAFITMAIAAALNAGLQASSGAGQRSLTDARIRVIFDALTRDIQSAYASSTNPWSVFTTNTTIGGQSSSGSTILTLMTLGQRITSDPPGGSQSSMASPDSGVVPQSDIGMVRWDFDSSSHHLSRITNRVPSVTSLMQAVPAPEDLVDDNVQEVDFSFYDSVQQQWQNTWDLQPLQTASSTSTSSTGSTTGATSTASTASTTSAAAASSPVSTASQASAQGQNSYLPQLVKITVILLDANGTPQTYTTQVPLVNWATLSGQSLTTSSSSTSGGTGTTGGTGTGTGK